MVSALYALAKAHPGDKDGAMTAPNTSIHTRGSPKADPKQALLLAAKAHEIAIEVVGPQLFGRVFKEDD